MNYSRLEAQSAGIRIQTERDCNLKEHWDINLLWQKWVKKATQHPRRGYFPALDILKMDNTERRLLERKNLGGC